MRYRQVSSDKHPVWYNQSGRSTIGSHSTGTATENILYHNVYTNGGNQIFMIKSNGGSRYVRNVLFESFISRGTAYGLNVDQHWSRQTIGEGYGVQLSNLTFKVSTQLSSRPLATNQYGNLDKTGVVLWSMVSNVRLSNLFAQTEHPAWV
ncbi:hypothetical protein ACEPAI_1535 [Sanghuangporus weigelae]